jgi:hypothetical protein
VTVTQNGAQSSKTLRTNASGVATWSFAARYSGTVSVTAGADLSYLAATATARFTTPSAVSVGLTGATRITKGVAHYKSIGAVRATVRILPKRYGKVTVTLQHRSGSKWKTDQQVTFSSEADGTVVVRLSRAARKVTFRLVAKAVTGPAAGASPTVVSRSFVVD